MVPYRCMGRGIGVYTRRDVGYMEGAHKAKYVWLVVKGGVIFLGVVKGGGIF